MRGLKIAAIISVSLLLVMAVLVGYLFLSSEVLIVSTSARGIPVGDHPQEFETLKASIADDTFIGTLFQQPMEWKEPSEYVYLEYTVRIRNNCLVPIDMIEVQIIPQADDILQVADLNVYSLDIGSEGDMKVKILAPADTHPVREMIVTYYVWGVSFHLKTTFGT